MSITKQIAKSFREMFFGGNWTCANLKDKLQGLSWQQVLIKPYDFNSIATLTYHTTYYVTALVNVLHGKPLDTKDEFSFNHPPIQSQEDWQNILEKIWKDAEEAAILIEQLPDSILQENFTDVKYGTYYRNITGTIEHLHYHLGQIALIRKIILTEK